MSLESVEAKLIGTVKAFGDVRSDDEIIKAISSGEISDELPAAYAAGLL